MGTLELQLSAVLFFALAGYLLSARINQSVVVGTIIIGVLIGPSFLGLIKYTETIEMMAHLGAIMLLFAVGLEFKIREVYQLKYFCIAAAGLVLPWGAGYVTGALFGYGFRESMFIGVSLTATSIAITAKVLDEMKKLSTRAAKAIIGAAVIDDVLGLLALSVVARLGESEVVYIEIMKTAVKAGLFLSAGILAAPHIKKFFLRMDKRDFAARYPDFLFVTAVMFCFLYASLAEIIGLSAIVGAFLAGAVLEGVGLQKSRSLKDGAEYLHSLFGAIFFIGLGMLVDARALTLEILPFFGLLLIMAVSTKLFGCGASAMLAGYNRQEALIIGFGMAPRGEVAMIVALIGLSSKSIGQDIYLSIVIMSLMTTIMTPVVLKRLAWDH